MSSRTKVISEDEPDLKDFGARTKEVFIEALSLPGKVRSGMALRQKEIESGRAKFIPAEDVRRHVKARLKLIRAGSTGVTHR